MLPGGCTALTNAGVKLWQHRRRQDDPALPKQSAGIPSTFLFTLWHTKGASQKLTQNRGKWIFQARVWFSFEFLCADFTIINDHPLQPPNTYTLKPGTIESLFIYICSFILHPKRGHEGSPTPLLRWHHFQQAVCFISDEGFQELDSVAFLYFPQVRASWWMNFFLFFSILNWHFPANVLAFST